MEPVDRIAVAVLYRHQLFGEGIAHFLAGEPDIAVESIAIGVGERSADALALGSRPDVVILERADVDAAAELLRAIPDALVIDVAADAGPTYAWRRQVIGSQPDSIVAAIRGFAEVTQAAGGGRSAGRRPPTRIALALGV